jgi:hypothetical protein
VLFKKKKEEEEGTRRRRGRGGGGGEGEERNRNVQKIITGKIMIITKPYCHFSVLTTPVNRQLQQE